MVLRMSDSDYINQLEAEIRDKVSAIHTLRAENARLIRLIQHLITCPYSVVDKQKLVGCSLCHEASKVVTNV